MEFDIIMGLEIHAQLKTDSKMFCECPNDGENRSANTTICEICTAQPGTLPVINEKAIDWTVLTGLALGCEIADFTKFDRKNYFYPDIPKGYQISQYDMPIASNGFLGEVGRMTKVVRIHLEEDTGKLLHPDGANHSLVDYNRAGTPLMELVTAPDITSAEDAKIFCQEYQQILRYLNVSDANMEKGQMRCEANISIQEKGRWKQKGDEIMPIDNYKLNPKIELKNINSFKAMEKAINYEIKRQKRVLADGGKLLQETRGWNDNGGKTYHQRTKESAHDYRYFPEPDLPPMDLTERKNNMKGRLPELPGNKSKRFIEEYGFNKIDARFIVGDKDLANYTENVVSEFRAWLEASGEVDGTQEEILVKNKKKMAKLITGWITNKLGGLMRSENKSIKDVNITPENFAEFLTLIYQSKINTTSATKVLEIMFKEGGDPSDILEQGDFEQIKDESIIDTAIIKAVNENEKAVKEYKDGKVNAIQFLVGQVMKETKGKADPKTVREKIEDKIKD